MATWTEADIPELSGRTVVITGANSGLGLRSSVVLAGKGARVFMACRSPERGAAALETVRATGGSAELIALDLADLASVRSAAAELRERTGDAIDVLMNNAGVMATPKRGTADGFELQFGTNHLGHAALTWLLAPALQARPGARVVTLSSNVHKGRGFDLADPNFERRSYSAVGAYSQSKLANLIFAVELDRRAKAAGLDLISVAAHPGSTKTELVANSARHRGSGPVSTVLATVSDLGSRLVTQSVAKGTLPQLYAATADDVRGGEYFGPSGPGEWFGAVGRATPRRAALNEDLGRGLWKLTAELTGVTPDPA